MASTIQLKTGTGSAVPSSLTQGELAINIDNGLIYYGSGSGNTRKQLESFTNITASGDISASGNIIANQFIGIFNGALSSSAQIASDISGALSLTAIAALEGGIISSSLQTFTNITASGNISASGYLVAQNITASNISASGYIYGRQFEQLDSVADTIVINTSYVYLPLGGQTLLESTSATNKNVQKIAMVPGKPRKVIMRVTSAATGFGTTGFTCSYHSAVPGAATVNLIGEKYANSLGTSHEVVTFDFTTGVDGGTSWDDVTPGSKVYLSLKATSTLGSIIHLGVASLWEWDYNA
jgi:hypothetical protein